MMKNDINFRRGKHWTTDAGYRETWGQIIDYRGKGALCVEMEGVGLFTIAKYRKCLSSAIYVISDVLTDNGWNLGWEENKMNISIKIVIDMILNSIGKNNGYAMKKINVYKELEISEKQIEEGNIKDAEKSLASLKENYIQ